VKELSRLIEKNEVVREVDLSRNMLYKVPEEIGHCTLIQKLYLDYNQLLELPETLQSLHSLQELRAPYNLISFLPVHMFNSMTDLLVLSIENNNIKDLPESLYSCSSLTFLDASNNSICSISESIGTLSNLKTLYLSHNLLELLPESISNCVELNVLEIHMNRMISLPEKLDNLRNLTRLSVYGNKLGPSVPSVIVKIMNRLSNINLSDNNLSRELKHKESKDSDNFTVDVSCTDIRILNENIELVWASVHANDSNKEADIFQNIGSLCSQIDMLTSAYFEDNLESQSSDSLLEYREKMKEYILLMTWNEGSSFDEFVTPKYAHTKNYHSLKLNSFEFPHNMCIDIKRYQNLFLKFQNISSIIFDLCYSYSAKYEEFKSKIHDSSEKSSTRTSDKKSNKSIKSGKSASDKPKQVSFRRSPSKKNSAGTAGSKTIDQLDNPSDMKDSNSSQVETSVVVLQVSGETEGKSDPVDKIEQTTEDIVENKASNEEQKLERKEEGKDEHKLDYLPKQHIPLPTRSNTVPLISDTVILNLLEQRQAPHMENRKGQHNVYYGSPDPVEYLLSLTECYAGLGTLCVRMADFLCVILRSLEDLGNIPVSCLSVCQRINDDFIDLMGEKKSSFIKKKFKAPGSQEKKTSSLDILNQLNDTESIKEAEVDVTQIEEYEVAAILSTVFDVEKLRRRLLLLAATYLGKSVYISKCNGWDGFSMNIQNGNLNPIRPLHHFTVMTRLTRIIDITYYYGLSMQKLRLCRDAVREYLSILALGQLLIWHPLHIELVKCYLDLGEFLKADETLYRIIQEAPARRIKVDRYKDIDVTSVFESNLTREMRMIAGMLSSALTSLSSADFGSKTQLNLFHMDQKGILHRRPVMAIEVVNGATERIFNTIAKIKAAEKIVFLEEKNMFKRSEVVQKVEDAKQYALGIFQAHEEFLDQMGPIVMPT
jgi:hypothetical protein